MSKNSLYAAKIAAEMSTLPTKVGGAVAKASYLAVLSNTKQDSGLAAFNWRAQINNRQVRPFRDTRGQAPVGSTGDKRSQSFDRSVVIDHRFNDFVGRLVGKEVRFVYIYNPIEDPIHYNAALIEQALVIGSGRDWLEDVAKGSIRAYL